MNKKRIIAAGIASLCFISFGLSTNIKMPGSSSSIVRADSSREYVEAFVSRMYTKVLGRDPEPKGLNDWTDSILSGQTTGATCAYGFFNSPEFINKNVSNEEYVDILYRAILGRDADPSGRASWVEWLNKGMTRNCVLEGFVGSQEYKDICAQYGVQSGSLNLTDPMDTHPLVNTFVKDLYVSILGRNPDPSGWSTWVNLLVSGQSSASNIVEGLIYSPEFQGRNLTDREYVQILYNGILGRSAGESELDAWTNPGYSRPVILRGILQSPEFSNKAAAAGIVRGDIDLNSPLEKNYIGREFAKDMYPAILGRQASEADLVSCGQFVVNGGTAADIINILYASPEFTGKKLSREAYITNVYQAVLGRTPSATDINNLLQLYDICGISDTFVLASVVNSAEFTTKCDAKGISQGLIAMPNLRDQNPRMSMYIVNMYKTTLGVAPRTEDLDYWVSEFVNFTQTGNSFLVAVTSQPQFLNLKDADKVSAIYRGALGRFPTDAEIASGCQTIKSSGVQAYVNGIMSTQEFKNNCGAYGIQPSITVGFNRSTAGCIYFDGNSVLSGWQRIDGNRYYFDPNCGNKAAAGWCYLDGYKYYFDPATNVLVQNVDPIIGHQSSYYLTVNCATNVVTVYAQSETGNYDLPVKVITCSTGRMETPTIHGTFTVRKMSRWGVLSGPVWGQYCSQISGNYLFHSSWYYENGNNKTLSVAQFNMLGQNASHGCVRLCTADAKWIYDNCSGSKVTIYFNPAEAPIFDKPVLPQAVPLNGDRGYDPTDPNL